MQPYLLSRLRPHAQSRPGQQVAFLARGALPCLAPNPLKANYKTVTVIAFLTMTIEPVLVGGREQDNAPLPLFVCRISSSPLCLLSPLVVAALIDIITVLATEGGKGVEG